MDRGGYRLSCQRSEIYIHIFSLIGKWCPRTTFSQAWKLRVLGCRRRATDVLVNEWMRWCEIRQRARPGSLNCGDPVSFPGSAPYSGPDRLIVLAVIYAGTGKSRSKARRSSAHMATSFIWEPLWNGLESLPLCLQVSPEDSCVTLLAFWCFWFLPFFRGWRCDSLRHKGACNTSKTQTRESLLSFKEANAHLWLERPNSWFGFGWL